MNPTLTKTLTILGIAAMVFGCMTVISYANVNQWDLGEVTQDGLKTLVTLGLAFIALQLKPSQVLLVLLALTLGSTSEAQAGPLWRLFNSVRSCRTCVRGECRTTSEVRRTDVKTERTTAKPQYRVECRGGVCRRVEVR